MKAPKKAANSLIGRNAVCVSRSPGKPPSLETRVVFALVVSV